MGKMCGDVWGSTDRFAKTVERHLVYRYDVSKIAACFIDFLISVMITGRTWLGKVASSAVDI